MRILVLHGPSLQLLGLREPAIYGTETLASLHVKLQECARHLGVTIECEQSNHEGVLIDKICGALGVFDGLILNAGAYTHTSLAIRDAVAAVSLPTIEVHLSNIFARESYRRHSYLSEVCLGVISGFGAKSYELALEALVSRLRG